jgi:major vault protein
VIHEEDEMAEGRERDLVLAPNEYAYILDETKGNVVAYVGPHKTSMANTDRPVAYDARSRRYRRCNLEEAIVPFPFAEEGWYVVLENPVRPGDEPHPGPGPNSLPKLTSGRKVNIPGPATFPLWPGQIARVIEGHQLRSNQYLIVQVYNEEAAGETRATTVIKGTDVSFYIPPTGFEVVPDARGAFVREAVTLERLEYCILLDEDGNKRFIQGPDVVFPKPTEVFVERGGSRKFRAIELNEISGIYVKVIAPYFDEKGVEHPVGEELFITGRDQMIYFPRPEHAIIKYGEREIHYAVAIPAGEARYVLDRMTGDVSLVRGPTMFLPDPRRQVIVRRVLSAKECSLMFPGSPDALEYNRRMAETCAPAAEHLTDDQAKAVRSAHPKKDAAPGTAGDEITRRTQHEPPRTITLNTKYEGAVSIEVWTGYAAQVVGRSGARKVLVGPQTYLLEYDETLEALELSTGTPKSDGKLVRTAYLRVLNNKVSDVVDVETQDLVGLTLRLSYRVNFAGEAVRWFQVENYVKFLTDHMRSRLRNAVKRMGIEDFYARSIDVVRDAVLGAPGTDTARPGRYFEENGMNIYDVEVLDVSIGDEEIADLLLAAQHTRLTEGIKQDVARSRSTTLLSELALKREELARQLELDLAQIESRRQAEAGKLSAALEQQEALGQINHRELGREKEKRDLELGVAAAQLEQRVAELRAEVEAVVAKAGAVSPDLIAALSAFADKDLAGKMAQSMAPLAILGGRSVADVLAQLLRGTPLESALRPRITEKPAA